MTGIDAGVRAQLLIDSQKKSGWVAALLNLIIPGAGYMYAGRVVLGILAFLLVVTVSVVTFGLAYPFLVLVVFVDGFLCASRYNKKLTERVLLAADGRG